MKKIKKNILKSFLFICLGLTLTTIVFADARSGDVPSPPGQPVVTYVWDFGCILKYLAPVDDGGAPVLEYCIEYRYKGFKEWKVKGKSYTNGFGVDNMMQGKEAEFRVSAVNKFGRSQPSKSSGFILFEGSTSNQ